MTSTPNHLMNPKTTRKQDRTLWNEKIQRSAEIIPGSDWQAPPLLFLRLLTASLSSSLRKNLPLPQAHPVSPCNNQRKIFFSLSPAPKKYFFSLNPLASLQNMPLCPLQLAPPFVYLSSLRKLQKISVTVPFSLNCLLFWNHSLISRFLSLPIFFGCPQERLLLRVARENNKNNKKELILLEGVYNNAFKCNVSSYLLYAMSKLGREEDR